MNHPKSTRSTTVPPETEAEVARRIILSRRAQYVALALAAAGLATNACGGDVENNEDGTGGSSVTRGGMTVCLSIQPGGYGGNGGYTTMTPCLNLAVGGTAGMTPCLSIAPSGGTAGMTPCLSIAPSGGTAPLGGNGGMTPCLKIATGGTAGMTPCLSAPLGGNGGMPATSSLATTGGTIATTTLHPCLSGGAGGALTFFGIGGMTVCLSIAPGGSRSTLTAGGAGPVGGSSTRGGNGSGGMTPCLSPPLSAEPSLGESTSKGGSSTSGKT